MRLSFWLAAKYQIMLLDQIFKKSIPQMIVIVRKDGVLKHSVQDAPAPVHNDISQKPLFPINKERK